MRVLIADDDAMTRIALRKNLKRWDYEIIEARDGVEAWNIICGEKPPRIAILDWLMPGMEGVEICRRLQRSRQTPFIYTILLTIKSNKEDLMEALDTGAYNFLSKPVHMGELRSRILVGVRLVKAEDGIRLKNRQLSEINEQLNRTNQKQQSALKEIKALKGILPICSSCRKIRLKIDGSGEPESWVFIEEYIKRLTEAEFTHGVCPSCARRLYPELYEDQN